jgi:hypothetical protein
MTVDKTKANTVDQEVTKLDVAQLEEVAAGAVEGTSAGSDYAWDEGTTALGGVITGGGLRMAVRSAVKAGWGQM